MQLGGSFFLTQFVVPSSVACFFPDAGGGLSRRPIDPCYLVGRYLKVLLLKQFSILADTPKLGIEFHILTTVTLLVK